MLEAENNTSNKLLGELPGRRARHIASKWILLGYTLLPLVGVFLHFVYVSPPLIGIILPTLGISLSAIWSLYQLEHSMERAMITFSVLAMICLTILLIRDLRFTANYSNIFSMFYIGVFTIGLILGFKAAIAMAVFSAINFLFVGLYMDQLNRLIDPMVFLILSAVPAKVVEEIIKQSIADLEALNQRLEDMVAARTTELLEANDHLRQRTAELEAINQELDAFAHTVAHDLKGPLTTLVGFSTVLKKKYQELPRQRVDYYFRMMVDGSKKMARIIDELLLLAMMRQEDEVEVELLDMQTIVSEAVQRLTSTIEQHQAEIIFPESWPQAWGYGPWVEEIWANYISNAIKYGGDPPRIELGGELQANRVCFWVRDNGAGIPPEEQEQLFTIFTRLNQTRARGHGLGLSIVHRITKRLGGDVDVESHVGEGSTFKFTLPVEATDATSVETWQS